MKDEILNTHLLTRGLVEPAKVVEAFMEGKQDVPVGADILGNDELLARVAGIWIRDKVAMEAVIRARLLPMALELLMKAYPQETIVIRQSMVDVSAILDDLERYAQEYNRRESAKRGDKNVLPDKPIAHSTRADNVPDADNNSPPGL